MVECYAPANIALVKYWGKREAHLNLPLTDSLSISLAHLGTTTQVSESEEDSLCFNGEEIEQESALFRKTFAFIDRIAKGRCALRVVTNNTIPTASGLASSASGFAALTLALNAFFNWNYDRKTLSQMARLGSGSASRSLWDGFVIWQAGSADDGSDCYAYPLEARWQELRIGILEVDFSAKKIGSREAMQHTAYTSPLYGSWQKTVAEDMRNLQAAIQSRDFTRLGEIAEGNALAMHALMLSARPAILYFQQASWQSMHTIWQLRAQGLPLYFTADAGANLKLLYLEEDSAKVKDVFPHIQEIAPFASS